MDINNFTNIIEFNIYLCAFGFMLLSEFIIFIFATRKNGKDRKKSDKCSIWLIILAYWLSIYLSYQCKQPLTSI
ncbi:hypothetical protein FHU23_002139 [Clostridium saccharobutylicum]|nr:hypothetical protein CLOSC_18860 [Clostridium saccharobutylicum]OAV39583.1 hypothetical protein M945_2985 [Clostridium saccharobutylicum DSM 13864]AQS00077.1 hypothetical protein CSACC_18930 [Clostridium saccharobutylicum]AQS14060.1 hypothetical protein CLOSACC_18930 [Clostridium saccharobutylicum]MBA2905511.1 hypothetical protein [Clostridium saccharobutylicum]